MSLTYLTCLSLFIYKKQYIGTLYCDSCDAYFSAAQMGDKNYRIQLIGRHIVSAAHQKHTRSPERGNDLVLSKKESEYILRLQLKFVVKTNQKMDIFR